MKTLFLQAPSYDGFDGGAGSRYRAKREGCSVGLAQPVVLAPDNRVLDATTDGSIEHNALHPSLERFPMQQRLRERVEFVRFLRAHDA